MADYIKRESVLEAFENSDTDIDNGEECGFSSPNIRRILESVPTENVIPATQWTWT